MAYNNNIMFIRYQLLARLVKMWKENELLEKIDRLPVELHPRKQKPLGRCCVYKERAVTKYKTMAMMGFDMTDETDETERLSTYAARCIENEVLMQLRAAKKRRNDISLTDPIGMDGEGNDISSQDILRTPGDMVEDAAIRRINMQQVRAAQKKLPQRERAVLEMRYGLLGGRPLLQHEVASKMGISRSYISRIETHAIALIRDEIMGKR